VPRNRFTFAVGVRGEKNLLGSSGALPQL